MKLKLFYKETLVQLEVREMIYIKIMYLGVIETVIITQEFNFREEGGVYVRLDETLGGNVIFGSYVR